MSGGWRERERTSVAADRILAGEAIFLEPSTMISVKLVQLLEAVVVHVNPASRYKNKLQGSYKAGGTRGGSRLMILTFERLYVFRKF